MPRIDQENCSNEIFLNSYQIPHKSVFPEFPLQWAFYSNRILIQIDALFFINQTQWFSGFLCLIFFLKIPYVYFPYKKIVIFPKGTYIICASNVYSNCQVCNSWSEMHHIENLLAHKWNLQSNEKKAEKNVLPFF